MQIDWGKALPVLISIGVILLVAALRNSSRAVAAIVATMPINIPLTLWIVASGTPSTPDALADFIGGLIIGLIPTFVFLVAAYYVAKGGAAIGVVIAAGYGAWGIALLIVLGIQTLLRR